LPRSLAAPDLREVELNRTRFLIGATKAVSARVSPFMFKMSSKFMVAGLVLMLATGIAFSVWIGQQPIRLW
jgi:hypothetical protein